jgi:hypothetical protein
LSKRSRWTPRRFPGPPRRRHRIRRRELDLDAWLGDGTERDLRGLVNEAFDVLDGGLRTALSA